MSNQDIAFSWKFHPSCSQNFYTQKKKRREEKSIKRKLIRAMKRYEINVPFIEMKENQNELWRGKNPIFANCQSDIDRNDERFKYWNIN